MTKIKLGTILEDAARLAGRDATYNPLPAGWKVLAAMSLNAGIRDLAAEKFPMLERIEFRRYRPTWNRNTAYKAGHEVWWEDSYWQAMRDISGVAPKSDDAWRKLDDGEVAAFIAFAQPWENTIIDLGGVDYTAFAYIADPRYNPTAAPIGNCSISSLGVLIPAPAPTGVWIKFIPEFPPVSFLDWVEGTEYAAGDVVYLESEKEVYQALLATAEKPSAASAAWQPVRINREFQTYLTRLVAADFLTEDQGKYQTRQAAASELATLHERYIPGVGSRRVRVGRFC